MWDKIYINKNNIVTSTAKAILIKMPSKCGYGKYTFWHPLKLVKNESNYLVSISFTDEFQFKLQQQGKGQHNFSQIVNERILSPDQLKKAFGFSGGDILDDLKD